MRILILTLTEQRDTIVDNLLAKRLRSQYGHEVHVHNYIGAGRQSVPYMKPQVVVHPMVGGQYKRDFVKKCKEWGCVVVVRRGEAGASRESLARMDAERQGIVLGNWDYEQYVDMELVWGPEFRDILVEKGKNVADKLRVCGGFAFDRYFQQDCKRVRNRRKTALFATAWSTADSRVDHCECGLPEESPYHSEIYTAHTEGRRLWIQAIRKLHELLGHEWEFTLKVRPGERTREYREKLAGIVEIYDEGFPAHEALKRTDLLIHAGSTMAVEAHIMGIPSVNFHNTNPDSLLACVCPRVESAEELEYHFRNTDINNSNVNSGVLRELQQRLYGTIDGLAHVRAAEHIDTYVRKHEDQIRPEIPDEWPKEPLYLEDGSEGHVELPEDKENYERWLCPCCKNFWYVGKEITTSKCIFCGMSIEKLKKSPLQATETTVLK